MLVRSSMFDVRCSMLDGWMVGWLDGWMIGWLDDWMVGWLDGWMVGWWMVGWLDGCAGIHDFGSCGPWIVLLCVNSNALQESPFFPTADPLCANKQHPLQLARLPIVPRSSDSPRLAVGPRFSDCATSGFHIGQVWLHAASVLADRNLVYQPPFRQYRGAKPDSPEWLRRGSGRRGRRWFVRHLFLPTGGPQRPLSKPGQLEVRGYHRLRRRGVRKPVFDGRGFGRCRWRWRPRFARQRAGRWHAPVPQRRPRPFPGNARRGIDPQVRQHVDGAGGPRRRRRARSLRRQLSHNDSAQHR